MNIYEKIIELRKAVPYLQKDTEDKQGVISSSVLSKVRGKMDELKLVLIPSVTEYNTFPKKTYGKETSIELFTEIKMEYTWINAEDPKERIIIPWYSQGLDFGEKGIGKALTYGEKYVILKTLQIPTDKDDPDTFANKNIQLITKVQIAAIQNKCNAAGIGENIKAFTDCYDISSKTTTKEEADMFLEVIDQKIKEFKGE